MSLRFSQKRITSLAALLTGLTVSATACSACATDRGNFTLDVQVDANGVPLGDGFVLQLTLSATGDMRVTMFEDRLCQTRLIVNDQKVRLRESYRHCHGKWWSKEPEVQTFDRNGTESIVNVVYSATDWHELGPGREYSYVLNGRAYRIDRETIRVELASDVYVDVRGNAYISFSISPDTWTFSSRDSGFLAGLEFRMNDGPGADHYSISVNSK